MSILSILTIVVGILVFVILILGLVYWNISRKEKKEKQKNNSKQGEKVETNKTTKVIKEYTKASIFDFMEFDKIEDNMIKQMDGKKYLMIAEMEGINYDLMSEIEKTSVEQGFIEFLNTLRHPIQLYVQTRTINISNSIENYNKKTSEIKQELEIKQNEYNKMLQAGAYNNKAIENLKYEIARIQNMYDYGKDVVKNIEQMSQNKNVLRKYYYIVIPYYTDELGNDMLSEEEKRNMVFSELYTRTQTVIRTLSACSMKGKVLDSTGLAELLYVAYNRDESEVYGIDRALRAGYNELYSTAQDVLDKRMEALEQKINERAFELARATVDEVKTEKEKALSKKEKSFDDLVREMAKTILSENEQYIGEEVAEKAKRKISKNTKEEVSKNAKKEKATRRVTE